MAFLFCEKIESLTTSLQKQLSRKGISPEEFRRQIDLFEKGFEPTRLVRPCSINDGIVKLNSSEEDAFLELFDRLKSDLTVVKFVPASGAASRMFKHLFSVDDRSPSDLILELTDKIDQMPFIAELKQLCSMNSEGLGVLVDQKKFGKIASAIIEGLNFKNLPKGLIPFHSYPDHTRNAFEEHLVESDLILGESKSQIHFTVSAEYLSQIKDSINSFISNINGQSKFDISYSFQEEKTDTVAVNLDNTVYIQNDNTALFRPGGHGSLIHNLNEVDADLVFVKNIDNVVPDKHKHSTVKYKKILAGFALKKQQEMSALHDRLTTGRIEYTEEEKSLLRGLNLDLNSSKEEILRHINRPIRVCGMVENTGEPGGGPFWTKNAKGQISRQIVEKAQVDLQDESQAKILGSSSHFNPVDMVCLTKNFDGESYNLLRFTDPDTSFISEKSIDGKTIKALEHPGLWNGAMSDWITFFLEVPLSTFNPVKTVNDLLRPMHQSDED